jgi:CRISPR/Cas system-associated exonuclease Cas4 (RecB family)
MTYSYTQISQYLTCPRRYRYRYLDGWKEKDTRAAMLFGRAFERALGAYFRREDTCAPPITDEQRLEFGRLIENTIGRIEAADFLPHSGIRFPQNPCSSCPYMGLCLSKQNLVEAALVRRPGAENLGWLDELAY